MTGTKSKSRIFLRVLPLTIVAAVLILIDLIPILWFILGSFKTESQLFSISNTFVFSPTFENYEYAFATRKMFAYLINSLIVTVSAVSFQLLVSIPAAYSLARYRSRVSTVVGYVMLGTRLLPAFVVIIPLYLLYLKMGLLNTRFGLIFAYTAFGIPFAVWMISGFLRSLPREIEEQAMIDGSSVLGVIVKVVTPLALPGIVATGLLLAIPAWGEFIFAVILTLSPAAQTLPPAISGFHEAYGVKWGAIMASSTVALLPILIMALVSQRYLLRGIVTGAIK